MKKFCLLTFVILFSSILFSQTLYQKYEYTTLEGYIYSQNGSPLKNCEVIIRTVYQGGYDVDVDSVSTKYEKNVAQLNKAGWGKTDNLGFYSIKGIPAPGDYLLEITAKSGHKKTIIPYRLDKGWGDKAKVQNIFLQKKLKIKNKTKKKIKKANELFNQGKLEKAYELSKSILSENTEIADAYFIIGNYFIPKKDYNKALENFSKSIEIGVSNPNVFSTAARIAYGLKKYNLTIDYLNRGVLFGLQKDMSYYQLLFQSYQIIGDKENFKKTIKELLDTNKNFKNREQIQKIYDSIK